ncbi:hypothetical protein VTL71DRAFT_9318 [Oculimacula yallundae]|uniref:Gfo/Idh/MocA-like oxidoreductase C-terminal domain-containing protein n=1 Tax=Oculimacula yallundae TaxID=86028 RepID=A0ABR4BTI4_9HELO
MSSYYGSSSFHASVWQGQYEDKDEPSYDYTDSDTGTISPTHSTSSSGSDSSATATLTIVQFSQPFPGLHWGILLTRRFGAWKGDLGGPCYDVWYDADTGIWEKKVKRVDFATDTSLVWDNNRRAESYIGQREIGFVEDVDAFERVIDDTPVPVGMGHDANCQVWVRDVVKRAVRRGLVDEDALIELESVPNY